MVETLDGFFRIKKDVLNDEKLYSKVITPNYDTLGSFIQEASLTFDKNDDFIYLPKFLPNHNIFREIKPLIQQYEYHLPNIKYYDEQFKKKLECKYEPLDYQKPVVNDILSRYKSNKYVNGILQLSTGFGKTFLSLYISSVLNLRTLIIVDDKTLIEQWAERIKEYFNLKDDDIGYITGGKINTSLDKRFTISYIQTINSKIRNKDIEFLKKLKSLDFGLIIFDECHKVSASEKYSKASSIWNTANILGLSATPYKSGIQKILLETSIGDIIVTGENYAYHPKVYILNFKSNIKDKRFHYLVNRVKNDYIKLKGMYTKAITKTEKYYDVVNIAADEMIKSKHKFMIIATTIEQCQNIANRLRMKYPDKNIVELHSSSDNTDVSNADIIVGTYKKCSHGFDKKDLSGIIIASPYSGKTALIQIIGRILRYHPDKKEAVVIYLNDTLYPQIYKINNVIDVIQDKYENSEVYQVNID